MANSWFVRQSPLDPTLESSYTKVSGIPSCTGTDHICAVYATVNGDLPIIDEALLVDMVQALDTRNSGPNVGLKS